MKNRLREVLAKTIEKNGGYHGNHNSYCLEWDVSLPYVVENLQHYVDSPGFYENFHYSIETKKEKKIFAKAVKIASKIWNSDKRKSLVWDWVADSMRGSYEESDTMRGLSPNIANKWGISDDTLFDIGWELEGRGGKHLVLTSFEGCDLRFSTRDVVEELTQKNGNDGSSFHFPNKQITSLLALIDEFNILFTDESLEKEFQFNALFYAAKEIENAWDEAKEKIACKRLRKAIITAYPVVEATETMFVCSKTVVELVSKV